MCYQCLYNLNAQSDCTKSPGLTVLEGSGKLHIGSKRKGGRVGERRGTGQGPPANLTIFGFPTNNDRTRARW